jgi:hypothetical protein
MGETTASTAMSSATITSFAMEERWRMPRLQLRSDSPQWELLLLLGRRHHTQIIPQSFLGRLSRLEDLSGVQSLWNDPNSSLHQTDMKIDHQMNRIHNSKTRRRRRPCGRLYLGPTTRWIFFTRPQRDRQIGTSPESLKLTRLTLSPAQDIRGHGQIAATKCPLWWETIH